MNDGKSLKIEFERRWYLVAGVLAVLGVALIGTAMYYVASQIDPGDRGSADFLLGVEKARSAQMLGSILQGLGYILLAAPLAFLFKAAAARSDKVKTGLIGVIVVAPLFMGVAAMTSAVSNLDAAKTFAGAEIQKSIAECVAESNATPVEVPEGESDVPDPKTQDEVQTECADDKADDVKSESSLRSLSAGLGFAGVIGFAIGVVYTSLWAMRTGLLTRFWGSLGMAAGAVSVIIAPFLLIWFIFVGLLLAGWVPGGRPPAWASGNAEPWPDPRQLAADRAAAENDDVIDGTAEEIDPDDDPSAETTDSPDANAPQIERRKRKKRSN